MLIGCDFSSAPTKRKPVVVATGSENDGVVHLTGLQRFDSLDDWSTWLQREPAWVGGFDLPFGLPRELVTALGWPLQWDAMIAHYRSLTRGEIRSAFAAFCDARPVGGKFAHRATDAPAGSSPSMKWVNPPVAFMLHAGVPRLVAAGAEFPGHRAVPRGAKRIALEAYPGLLARELIGRTSYKSDDRAAQTEARRSARAALLQALVQPGSAKLQLRLALGRADRDRLIDEGSADGLDAVLCLMQAAWAFRRRSEPGAGWGLPANVDPLEGWIVSA